MFHYEPPFIVSFLREIGLLSCPTVPTGADMTLLQDCSTSSTQSSPSSPSASQAAGEANDKPVQRSASPNCPVRGLNHRYDALFVLPAMSSQLPGVGK